MKISAFKKRKYTDMTGLVNVTWDDGPLVIARASQRGVTFATPVLSSMNDLSEFARLVDVAWREHLRLVPKITKRMSGHD